ncbi:MAG TPA: TolC family protein [Puia sp.]
MTKTKKLVLFLCSVIFYLSAAAQDKWDLRRCVEYAVVNNISIKQADIDSRVSKLAYDQAKWSQFGNVSFNSALGLTFGRSIDRTTNIYVNTQSLFHQYNLNAGISLFNWFALRRAEESNKFSYQAQVVNIDKIKNDITLNVAAAYLQALLSREQVTLAKTKLELTRQQLENTRKLVDAGSVPELNAAELEVQFATDTSAVISAQETYDINNLQLKAILNLDAAAPFDLDTPPVENIPVEPIAGLQPDIVYAVAVGTFPQQKMNDLRIRAAQKNVDYNRGLLYPSLSLFAGLGDNFANSLQPFGKVFNGYGNQLSNNFGQNVGLQLTVPIFNGNLSRTNYKRAQLGVITAQLTKENDLLTLKQNIYQSYYNAVASLQKYDANQKAVTVAEKSFDLSTKRYNIGMLNTIDYLTNQNNLFSARINALIAHYDYVFRMKVLEYYKGLGIKL